MSYATDIASRVYENKTNNPVRAAIYARVSTDNEGQKESCANQVSMAMSFINQHPNITLFGTYVDDGISGKSDYNRPEYNRMLADIETGSIDLVIVKAFSRLNRNQFNSLVLIQLLQQCEATILSLEDQCVHDFEDRKEKLYNSIKFAMDADVVSEQREKGLARQRQRCEQKILTAKDASFGYNWDRSTKTISINPDEAEIVREIFEDYVYRNGTPASIHKKLQQKGISICGRSISNMIMDERYVGQFFIGKRTSCLRKGKYVQVKRPKSEWTLCERPDLQIIDTDLFEMAQRIHKTRITIYEKPDKTVTQARFRGTHLYAGLLFCPICRRSYHYGFKDRGKSIPIYRIKQHSDCFNQVNKILEDDLIEITKQALKETFAQQNNVFTTVERVLSECVKESQNNTNDIESLKKKLNSRENQINNLMNELAEGNLYETAKNRIRMKINDISAEIEEITYEIHNKESEKLDDSYVSETIHKIKDAIEELRSFTKIDRERILNYINRIELPNSGDIEITFKTGQMVIISQPINNDFCDNESVGKLGIQHDPH